MNREKLADFYKIYELDKDDFYTKTSKKDGKKQYTIITRSGIEKIQAIEDIQVSFEVIECTPNFAAVKATHSKGEKKIETYGSAFKGATWKDGNTESWYVLELAEKRALARVILKAVDLYKHGFFAEDESEEFKKKDA
jgi:hypothetical protein